MDGETGDRLLPGADHLEPAFPAEWVAMDQAEYAARFLDPPDWILDAAPEDDLPEHIRTAWQEAEAEQMIRAKRPPDPLSDPPGPRLAAYLAEPAAGELGDAGLIDRITGLDRQAAWAAAGQLRAIAELAKRRVTDLRSAELGVFVDELALALTCTRYAAWARLHTALDLVDRLPDTLAALGDGRICVARARVIAEGTRALTDTDAALVQVEVLTAAEALTPAKLRTKVVAAAAAVDPRGADEAHEDACDDRTVVKYPREHGMTGIWALLPADHAAAVWAAVNTHAETTRQPEDHRTAEQRRADSLTEVMTAYLDGTCMAELPGAGAGTTRRSGEGAAPTADTCERTGASDSTVPSTDPIGRAAVTPSSATESMAAEAVGESGVTATRGGCRQPGGHRPPKVPGWCRVQVKVSADWLLGHSTEAPVLTGHGPLPADVALRLIADAGWQRIIYHPQSGALLDAGTTVHDPPLALREHVLVRDGGCTQPICSNPRVDLDHNTPYPHGPTSEGNLRSRCRHHHHLKQHPRWEVRVGEGGRIDWITPTGHAYPEHTPDLRPGPTATPRPDPHIGPDADQPDDPPPF